MFLVCHEHTYKQEGVSDAEDWQERDEARYFRTLVRNVARKVAGDFL